MTAQKRVVRPGDRAGDQTPGSSYLVLWNLPCLPEAMENLWTGGPAHRFPTTSLESRSAKTLHALPQPLGKTRTFSHSYAQERRLRCYLYLGKGGLR